MLPPPRHAPTTPAGFHGTVRRPVESEIEKRGSRHISQEVCPWNRFSPPTHEPAFRTREGLQGPELVEWMTMTQEEFSRRFKNSPIKRTKHRGLLRNVAVALGNWGTPDAVPALAVALNDEEPLVRGHAAWALGRIPDEQSVDALRERLLVEEDEWVLSEIQSAPES